MDTKGYSTTMAISTFKKLDAKQSLHRGTSDLAAMPESRLAERVFGADGPGRSKGLSSGLSIGNGPLASCWVWRVRPTRRFVPSP